MAHFIEFEWEKTAETDVYNVVVVGAGYAGLSAAIEARKAGAGA